MKLHLISHVLLTFLTSCPNYTSTNMATNRIDNQQMPISKIIQLPTPIKKVTLLAREEKTPPIGQPLTHNRDIGFASVFIHLENPDKERNSRVIIQNIEIVNYSEGQLQNFIYLPTEIVLRPLENSKQLFALKNKTGYLGQEKVKAIVTYQTGNEVNLISSEPIEVIKF
jgi:hypothetical protein